MLSFKDMDHLINVKMVTHVIKMSHSESLGGKIRR